MSRILDAIVKAQREGQRPAAQPPPLRVGPERLGTAAPSALPRREVAGAVPLRHFTPRQPEAALFSRDARRALARSYETIERFCDMERGLVLDPGLEPVRTVLVATPGPAGSSAVASLALAATLSEKTRSRVLLVDAEANGSGLSGLVQTPHAGPGLWDGVLAGGELEESARRTELAGLFFLPGGRPATGGLPPADTVDVEGAIGRLLEYFHVVILHVGSLREHALAGSLARHAEAILLVASHPAAIPQDAWGQPLAGGARLKVIGELEAQRPEASPRTESAPTTEGPR